MKKVALIAEIARQDGFCRAGFLPSKEFKANGIKLRASSVYAGRVDPAYQGHQIENARFNLCYDNLAYPSNLTRFSQQLQPDEFIAEMVREDVKSAERDKPIKNHGFSVMERYE
jgi:GDP-D-mannose dehydratase